MCDSTRKNGLVTKWLLECTVGDLKSVKLRLVCIRSVFWKRSEIRKTDHLKSEQMAAFLSKSILIQTETSGFEMALTIAIDVGRSFKNWIIWNVIVKKTKFQMFLDFEWPDFRSPLNKRHWTFENCSIFRQVRKMGT